MKNKIILSALLILLSVGLYPVYYGKNKVQKKKVEWSVLETMHFDIYFKKDSEEFGRIAALMSEEAYYYLKQDFKEPIRYRIPIIFYESHSEFETTNIIYPLLSEGVGGFTEYEKNRVVVPFDGSYRKLEEVLVHELTHAYVKAVSHGGLMGAGAGLPFWFSEGLPEFESIGGKDNYNNMFIIDMILNDGLYPINQIGGYYAYRMGEAFLTWISEVYGRDMVMKFFHSARIARDPDASTQKTFGMKFEELEQRWEMGLKRKYYPLIGEYKMPFEVLEKQTNHEKTGSNMNYAPRFSPNGQDFLYFANISYRTGIWQGSLIDLDEEKLMVEGETTGALQEFHFLRNNVAWLDEQRFALVAKSTFGDKLYIRNIETGRMEQEYEFPTLDNVYEFDYSPANGKFVLSGQKEMATDLYIFDPSSGTLDQITDDRFDDGSPRWSPDGTLIAFYSERTKRDSTHADSSHVFYNLGRDIFLYNTREELFYQVTNDNWENHSPFWNSDGEKLLFVSEKDYIANFDIIELETGRRAKVTKTLCGVFTGDLSPSDEYLAFSCFYNNGWDVYTLSNPLQDLAFYDYHQPVQVGIRNDFYQRFDIDRYELYGKRDRKFKRESRPISNRNVTTIDLTDIGERDSLAKQHNLAIDERPDTVSVIPELRPFRLKWSLDRFWGGMAYSSSYGALGYFQFSMSDLMGDHALGVQLSLAGDLDDSSAGVMYYYLPHRIDLGVGGFYYNTETIYLDYWYDRQHSRYADAKIVERDFGLETVISYPFNKFWRLDFTNSLSKWERDRYAWDYDPTIEESADGEWELVDTKEAAVYSVGIDLAQDNTLWSNTGPISGWRGAISLDKSLSKDDEYFVAYGDLRSYLLFNKRYAFAFRFLGGASTGKDPRVFSVRGYNGVRGVRDDIDGDRKFLGSIELRYPLIEYFQINFPLPIVLQQLRGSIFYDFGSVWFDEDGYHGIVDDELQDLKMGYGFGPRWLLGWFVFKLDIAWETDLNNSSKPTYYLWLAPDF